MMRELTPDERERVAAFFGRLGFDQNRHWLLEHEDLIAARARNNVERPSFFGALIHDLLNTCAVLATQRDERDATLAAIARALGPYATGEIAGDVTALRDAYDLLRMEIRAAARAERTTAAGDRRFRCDACGREASAAGACAECGAPVRPGAIEEKARGYEREPEDDDVG